MDVSHCATARVNANAAAAFDFLADPIQLGTWSLGCMNVQKTANARVFSGTSLYDGSTTYFEVLRYSDLLLIDYRVGSTEGELKPRISVRIVRGEDCDLPSDECYVTLLAWRPEGMSEERWKQLRDAHEAEIWLIKSQIEAANPAA